MSHMNGLYPNLIDRMEAYLMSQMAAQGGIPPSLYTMHGEYSRYWQLENPQCSSSPLLPPQYQHKW